jgi:hypothetical protein
MSDFYIYASSAYDAANYPTNTASDFIVELPAKLSLKGSWVVGVLDVQLQKRNGPKSNVYLCCDVVTASYVGGQSVPILKTLNIGKGLNNAEFSNIQYVRLKACDGGGQMRLSIKDVDTLDRAPLLQGVTRCTLHFKPQRE